MGTKLNVELLEKSFALLAPQADRLVKEFYAELFRRHPQTKALFAGTDPAEQRKKLIGALQLVVSNVRQPEKLVGPLQKLGAKHVGYGAKPGHYGLVAAVLIDVMKSMAGSHWTAAIENAWREALSVVAGIMLKGAKGARVLSKSSSKEHQMATNGKKTKASGAAAAAAKREADNQRIKSALDSTTTNVMLADENLNIIYLNKTVVEMMRAAESDIRKDLPRFDVNSLIGTNIDSFHKNPAHQRGMLAGLSKTFESRLSLGGRTFRIIANPVLDDAGGRLGTVVEWSDLTDQLRREAEDQRRAEAEAKAAAENLRIRTALDSVSGNVMMADADNRIIYMNNGAASLFQATAADLRRDLPNFDAGKLIGSSIDLFHKNPAHQQRALADLRSTFTAQLKVGGRTFRIIANPVMDSAGKRAGTVVEWIDRTQEVAVEEEVGAIVTAAQSGDLSKRIRKDDKQGFFQTLASGINGLLDNMSGVVDEVNAVVEHGKEGDLTARIETAGKSGAFEKLWSGINALIGNMMDVVKQIKAAAGEVQTGAEEICQGQYQPVAAHRGAGLEPGGDGVLDGRDDLHGQAERRQRRPGQPAGDRRARRRPRRAARWSAQAVEAMSGINAVVEEDRRHHRRDRRDRLPDQPAGAERGGGSRARRRAGPRLRGGGDAKCATWRSARRRRRRRSRR